MKKHLLKTMLVGVMALAASSAWAQTTWEFAGNTAVWGAEGVTLNAGAQYDESANAVATGGVTFTSASGFVSTNRGIGFTAIGSTEAENISVVVPVGYKATVSAYTSGNRTIVGAFGETTQTFNAGWASSTKEFSNAEGAADVTLYLYCNQNPGGADQSKAPFLEKIVLTDLASVKSFPWTASAVATIGGSKTTIKTYSSAADVDEGTQYRVTVDKVIEYDGAYYVLNDSQFGENIYGATFTMGDSAPSYEFNYELLENVAFYGEVEDIYSDGLRANKIQDVSILSNGGGYTGQGTEGYVTLKFNVAVPAVYKLVLGMNNTNDKSRGFNYSVDGAEVSETITVGAGAAFVQEIENQTLAAGDHTLTLNITYSLTPVFDYLLVMKTGEADPAIAALAAAKQALQDAIDQVKGYEIAGLADAIAAAEAAVNAEDATLESLQAAAATFEGTVKTYLKTVLTMGLPMIESMYGEDLATYINDAKAVLAKEDATVEDLAGAMFALSNSAKPYLRGSLENALALANSLGVDTSAVQAVLANEDATGIELITALMTLMTNAVPAINEAIATVKEFFATFNTEASTALAEYFTNFEDAIKTNDLKRIYDTMDALIEAGRPYGLVAAQKAAEYLAYMEDEALNADLVEINAAFQNQDLAALIAAVKKAETDFFAAAPGFINKVEFAAAAEYDNGKTNGYEDLTKAINDAKAVINDENKTLFSVVLAVRNVIIAVQTFEAKNAEAPVVFPANAIVFDFEAAAAAGENPANKNGSAANGQAFYGWENVEKTDSKRQDYKGYEWAEGSLLPEVCQVWRRSDRINGNIVEGGLNCPNDREVAIDGLVAGSTVIVVYDATNATDGSKELVWAIGDGSSESLEGPRATATINGVEAVSGETTIASGAEILVNSVTPAENGTGYIVFQVKKGMIIKQIAVVPANEWAKLIADAEAIVDNEAVAVGKLIAAIEVAKGQTGTDEEKAVLEAAVEQYLSDNADQEKDETAKVATDGWKNFNGDPAGVCATQFAPAITTYDGRTANLAEVYEQNDQAVGRTGTIIYQDITGLENGKYKVGFYGNAFFTEGRGMTTTMEDGAEDVAYVFANEQKEFIVAKIATSTTENNFRQFDVEVTDGTIKLGMGKEQAGTNWHTMQIYQLTWFTTAKEVYAKDQDELKALMEDGKALLADESNTEGRETFQQFIEGIEEMYVGSNMYNIPEIESVISGVKSLIANFKKNNAIIPEGKYYLVAMPLYEEDNCYMAAGMNWGTQGIVNGQGLDLNFIYNADAENYTIDTNIYNGSDHFLGSNLFMDGPSFAWSIEKDAVNGHCIYAMFDGVKKYIGVAADNRLELTETPYAWKFLEAKELEEEMKKLGLLAMEFATVTSAVDATFLLKDAQFNRNDHRWEAWIVSDNCTNKNLGGGCDESNGNGCAESFHSPFTISQTLTNVPSGTYGLTAQGFYRQDDDAEEAAPCFFLNDAQTEIPLRTGSENSMTEAGKSFAAGNYIADMIFVYVASDGELTVGVTNGENTHQWVIWDNFVLTYYGSENLVEDITTGINELKANGQQTATDGVYTLSGQKVQKTQKGLYIVNGKKVVLK